MSEKPISPLRQRMIDDMTARRFGEHTQRDYVRAVKNFADYLGCSPAKASAEDLRRYQLHLAKQHASPATINQACSALRFFFRITLDRPYLTRHLAPVQRPRKMPAVLSPEEVARLIWRSVTGLTGFWPGKSQTGGRAARHHSRRIVSSCGDSITYRSRCPLPRSTRSVMRPLSMSETFSLAISDTRRPAP